MNEFLSHWSARDTWPFAARAYRKCRISWSWWLVGGHIAESLVMSGKEKKKKKDTGEFLMILIVLCIYLCSTCVPGMCGGWRTTCLSQSSSSM